MKEHSEQEIGIEVPYAQLAPETLNAVIESFILRNGTDYGTDEVSLESRVAQVKRQLERGEAVIVYDSVSESCSVVPAKRRAQ